MLLNENCTNPDLILCNWQNRNPESPCAPQRAYFFVIPEWRKSPARPPSLSATAISFLAAAKFPLNKATVSWTSAPYCGSCHKRSQLSLEILTADGAGRTLDAVVWKKKKKEQNFAMKCANHWQMEDHISVQTAQPPLSLHRGAS